MKEIVRLMINEYKINELKMDFMGYSLQKNDIYTFHHLIIPKRRGGAETRSNGAILCGKTAHPYLHLIERVDYDIFLYITAQMIKENVNGYIDPTNIKNIYYVLDKFEREHCGDTSRKGRQLIKEEYTRRKKM